MVRCLQENMEAGTIRVAAFTRGDRRLVEESRYASHRGPLPERHRRDLVQAP